MRRRLTIGQYSAALLLAVAAGAFTFAIDQLFITLEIRDQIKTLNVALVAAFAGAGAIIWMKYRDERRSRAREKMVLVSELNHHIRNAVTLLGQSAALPDSPEKLRMIDAAVDRVDRVLTELVPTANTTDAPRLFLDERPEGLGSKRKR